MVITMRDHRPRSHSARPVSLAKRLEPVLMVCRKYPRTLSTGRLEKQGKGLRGHQAPRIGICTFVTRRGGRRCRRRRGRGEGLRKRDTRSSKLEERGRAGVESKDCSRFRISRSVGADWPAETLTRMTRGSRAAGDDSPGDGHWWAAICQSSSGIIRDLHAETGPCAAAAQPAFDGGGVLYHTSSLTSMKAARTSHATSTRLSLFHSAGRVSQFPLVTHSRHTLS